MEQKKEVEIMKPQKTWFFTDSTGRIFSANEKEAFDLLTNNSQWRRRDIKPIGTSDGKTYHKSIAESGAAIKELANKVQSKEDTLNRYIQGHDKLLFEDFAEETDPRVVRAKEAIKKTEDELEPLKEELRGKRANIVQTAFDAELEASKGHFEMPKDFSVIGRTDGKASSEAFMENFKKQRGVL